MNWKDWKKMSIGSRVTVQCGNHKGRSGVITWLHPSRRLTEIKLDIGGDPVRLCYTSLQPFGYDMYDRKKDHYERARNAFNTAYQRMHETVYIVDRDPQKMAQSALQAIFFMDMAFGELKKMEDCKR